MKLEISKICTYNNNIKNGVYIGGNVGKGKS